MEDEVRDEKEKNKGWMGMMVSWLLISNFVVLNW